MPPDDCPPTASPELERTRIFLPARMQGGDAIARFDEDGLAVMQHAILIEQDMVEAVGDLLQAGDDVRHGGPACRASSAAP